MLHHQAGSLPLQGPSFPLPVSARLRHHCCGARHRPIAALAEEQQTPTAGAGALGYEEQKAETYLGEMFWKSVPPEGAAAPPRWLDDATAAEAPPLQLVSLNHAALGVQDVDSMIKFYTRVLGMRQLPRPPFPFGGAWLQGGGLTLHLIDDDPTIPRKGERRWNDQFDTDRPEPWYIRRGAHKAFAVAGLADAELRLKHYGIEYHKFLVPGTSAAQIFFFDPEGNGIEMGEGYEEIAASLKGHEAGKAAAPSAASRSRPLS